MKKNCTTCLYEPEWFQDAGKCKFPLPLWAKTSTQNMVFQDAIASYDDLKCDTWSPKTTDEQAGGEDDGSIQG